MNQKNGMNDEQQIEEIALVLCGMTKGCDGCVFNKEKCFEYQDAKRIYNTGYRKQIEGEWVKQVKIRKQGVPILHHYQCSLCGVYLVEQANYCPNCGARMKISANCTK